MSLNEFSKEDAEEFRKELQRLSDLLDTTREDLGFLRSNISSFPMQIQAFMAKLEEVEEKLGTSAEAVPSGGSSDVAQAIKQGFADLIQYKQGFEAKMDARRAKKPGAAPAKTPTRVPAKAPSTAEPMALDIDISGIDWMQKNMELVGLDASWAWAFGYDQDGDVKPETEQLVEAIQQYGNVKVGKHMIGLGGNDNTLLQRKISKGK